MTQPFVAVASLFIPPFWFFVRWHIFLHNIHFLVVPFCDLLGSPFLSTICHSVQMWVVSFGSSFFTSSFFFGFLLAFMQLTACLPLFVPLTLVLFLVSVSFVSGANVEESRSDQEARDWVLVVSYFSVCHVFWFELCHDLWFFAFSEHSRGAFHEF